MNAFTRGSFKKLSRFLFVLYIFLSVKTAGFGQVDTNYVRTPLGWIVNAGESSLLTLRPELDAWTFTNYKLTEVQWPNIYLAGDIFYDRFKLGVDLHLGSAFQYASANAGVCVTGNKSPVSSWLEFEYGEMTASFGNIRPLGHPTVPGDAGQQMLLNYDQQYIGITSVNYPRILHFKLENQDSAPTILAHSFNIGFFFSLFYLPGRQFWRYGYYQSGNFQSVNIDNIPTLNQWEFTGGIFIGFSGRAL